MRILYKPVVAYKWSTPNPEREIEEAGRVCWESWGRSDGTINGAQDFIRRLKKVGHMDVLEEAELSVWIECSRTCSHQIVRHRTQHHLQASQRYIKAKEPEIMMPPVIAEAGWSVKEEYLKSIESSYETYKFLSVAGIRKEDARFVLPNAALTKLKAKGNFSNWRKFFSLRSDHASQWEIQMVSNAVLAIAYKLAPSVFEDQFEEYICNQMPIADIVKKEVFSNGWS